jgi:hypothetical protein
MMNRLRCQLTQKVFEDLMDLYRVKDPADRNRLNQIYMGINRGIIPEGLEFVKNTERYQPDWKMVESLMANFKQLMGEGTNAYTQDIDDGTSKERTAFEVNALMSQTTRLTGTILNLAYMQEAYAYQEIARRCTIKGSPDFLVKKFQNGLREDDVPLKWIDAERWEVEPERIMGSGNSVLEQAKAKGLMGVRQFLNPTAQQRVLNKYVFAVTHDPKEAEFLAPLNGAPQVSDTIHDTEIVYGSILNGSTVTPKPGLAPAEVVATILRLMEGTIQQVMQSGGMGDMKLVNGLMNAAQYTQAFIAMLAQDDTAKPLVKQFSDALGKMMNEVKAMAQRLQEAAQAAQKAQQQQQDPQAMAKVQAEMASLKVKLAGKKAMDQQTMRHKDAAFVADQRRKNMETVSGIQRKNLEAAMSPKRSVVDE